MFESMLISVSTEKQEAVPSLKMKAIRVVTSASSLVCSAVPPLAFTKGSSTKTERNSEQERERNRRSRGFISSVSQQHPS